MLLPALLNGNKLLAMTPSWSELTPRERKRHLELESEEDPRKKRQKTAATPAPARPQTLGTGHLLQCPVWATHTAGNSAGQTRAASMDSQAGRRKWLFQPAAPRQLIARNLTKKSAGLFSTLGFPPQCPQVLRAVWLPCKKARRPMKEKQL